MPILSGMCKRIIQITRIGIRIRIFTIFTVKTDSRNEKYKKYVKGSIKMKMKKK